METWSKRHARFGPGMQIGTWCFCWGVCQDYEMAISYSRAHAAPGKFNGHRRFQVAASIALAFQ